MEVVELEHRLTACEKDIKDVQKKQSEVEIEQAKINTKLDNLLLALGEVKASLNEASNKIEAIANRPTQFWDKLVSALIGAAAAGIIAYFIK